MGSQKCIAGTLSRGRLLLSHTDGILKAQYQRVWLCHNHHFVHHEHDYHAGLPSHRFSLVLLQRYTFVLCLLTAFLAPRGGLCRNHTDSCMKIIHFYVHLRLIYLFLEVGRVEKCNFTA